MLACLVGRGGARLVSLVAFLAIVFLSPARATAEPPAETAAHTAEDGEARPVTEQAERDFWWENMAVYHRFTRAEIAAVLGLTVDDAAREWAARRLDRPSPIPPEPGGLLTVRPYPGGRHPRLGFLDGAVRPQRETKFSVFAPWPEGGYAVVDLPEAIWFETPGQPRALLYLAHTHVPTVWDAQGVALPRLEWRREPGGRLSLTRELPNGVRFATTVLPATDGVRMELTLTNGSPQPLSGLDVQMCVMLGKLSGFADQTNDHKRFAAPFAAAHDGTGRRWIITAWEHCRRAWGNPPCPCLHSDPRLPDCPSGATVRSRGWVSFYEGSEIDAELARLSQSVWAE